MSRLKSCHAGSRCEPAKSSERAARSLRPGAATGSADGDGNTGDGIGIGRDGDERDGDERDGDGDGASVAAHAVNSPSDASSAGAFDEVAREVP